MSAIFIPRLIHLVARNNKLRLQNRHGSRFGHFSAGDQILFAERVKKCFYVISSAAASLCVYYWYRKNFIVCEKLNDYELPKEKLDIPRNYENAISRCRDIVRQFKDEDGIPGIVIGVSVDGSTVWEEGFGYSDVENRVECSPDTVMRIASISKTITMAAVAKLWEEKKIDLDKPVQFYVPDFPQKTFNGEKVVITCRHLLSHLGGIRHYQKKTNEEKTSPGQGDETKKKELVHQAAGRESEIPEYYIKDKFEDIKSALRLFQDDDLVSKPGTEFHYTTHGWTLISAIVEKAASEPFTTHITKLFKALGMNHSYLDVNDTLIYHRSRNYFKNSKNGRLINSPYVDNSCKWAGGGFLSTIGDLLMFGNAMLYSLQFQPNGVSSIKEEKHSLIHNATQTAVNDLNAPVVPKLPGFLKTNTLKTMWSPVIHTEKKSDWKYGLGWLVLPEKKVCEYCLMQPFAIAHTGGAVGASSILLILPKKCDNNNQTVDCKWNSPPKGVIVTIIVNLQNVPLSKRALQIAETFDTCED